MRKKRRSKKKKSNIWILDILIRYLILIIVAIPGLWLFYWVFTPITVSIVYFLISLFFEASLNGDLISLVGMNIGIKIIGACVAGSAYYLLLILNLSVPGIKLGKRFKMIFLAFAVFLFLNVLRIFFMAFLIGSDYFDLTHELFWYIGSVLLVIVIWFSEVKLFKIREIPIYSDIKFLYKKSNLKRK